MIHWVALYLAVAIVVIYHAVVITGIVRRERAASYRPPMDPED